MKKIGALILISALTLLAILALLFLKARGDLGQRAALLTSPGKEIIITLDEEGFSPRDIIILKGSVVKFVTTRGKPFWPASDLHPTHTIYPEFDPKEPVMPEDSWNFRFERVGAWKYHDHLAPYYTGTITVRETEESGALPESPCFKQECWQEKVLATFGEKGLEAAFNEVKRLYRYEPSFSRSCHEIVHELGHASYDLYSKTKRSPLTPQTAFCSYGFYHGFMDSFVLNNDAVDKAREFCITTDKTLGKETPDAYLQCFHGIGHGAVKRADRNVIGNEQAMAESALKICEKVSKADLELSRCASGVFNTIALAYNRGEYQLTLKKEDPLRLCRNVREPYQDPCYISMNVALMPLTQGNLREAAQFIEAIEKDEYAVHAMLNLAAISGAAHIQKTDYSGAIQACRAIQARLRLPCIQGFAFGMLEHGEPGLEYRKPLRFCASGELSAEEQRACFQYLSGYLGLWYPLEEARTLCDLEVAAPYRALCHREVERIVTSRPTEP